MSRLPLVASLAGLLLLAGCGTNTDTEPTGSPEVSDSASPTPEPTRDRPAGKKSAQVPAVLDFAATTVTGESFEGASLAGRPTLLWFWAPWCPTCRGQIPQVEGLAADYDGKLNVVGVGSLDSAEAIAGFADDVDGVTQLEDAEGELWKRFGVVEQSSFVLLDADGALAFEAGYGGSGDLDAEVDAVLG